MLNVFLISFIYLLFLLRDARGAKRGIAIVSRPSVCLCICKVP